MRLSTITNWAYGATVLLTLASGTTMLFASGAEQRERAAVAQRASFDQLTSTLEEDVYRLTEQARGYVISGDPSHLIVYRREKQTLKSVEQRIAHLRDGGAFRFLCAGRQQHGGAGDKGERDGGPIGPVGDRGQTHDPRLLRPAWFAIC